MTAHGGAHEGAHEGMAWVPGGTFLMGSDGFYPEERPVHPVALDGFWIDVHQVTNADFGRFVEATGHVTTAEIAPTADDYPGALPELLVVGSVVFTPPDGPVPLIDPYRWWSYVPGANWRHPEGPDSSIDGLDLHPVVHVTNADALAYAGWVGKDLPTEAEWEFAARGGLEGATYPWGDDFTPDGRQMANTWQGEFPHENLALDGYERTAPVGSFPPNGYGLHDVAGNVWEWTSDWYHPTHPEPAASPCCAPRNPRATEAFEAFDAVPRKVIKGGSHLCAPSYCHRYRPAARQAEPLDTSTSHIGFRCLIRP